MKQFFTVTVTDLNLGRKHVVGFVAASAEQAESSVREWANWTMGEQDDNSLRQFSVRPATPEEIELRISRGRDL